MQHVRYQPSSAGKWAVLEVGPFRSLDDLDNAACSRFDQNCTTVHHRVAMLPYAIFRRYVVIGYAFSRENRPDPHILTILI
jgi:hypothetical protein